MRCRAVRERVGRVVCKAKIVANDRTLRSVRLYRALTPFREFTGTEAVGGVMLLLATAVALIWANSPWGASYADFWGTELAIDIGGEFHLSKNLQHWINDGLMVIFFFVVGLEIKREVLVGELSSLRQALLPIVAAVGGALVPAAIFLGFNSGTDFSRGWGIPMATDIAFALGVLALLGSRVPTALKIFLTALAIVDDILAVLVIAVFYTGDLALSYLLIAGALFLVLVMGNRLHVYRPAFYAIVGVGLWLAFLKSGVHATVAGVLLSMAIPARTAINADEFVSRGQWSIDVFRGDTDLDRLVLTNQEHQSALNELQNITSRAESPMQRFQHSLLPWVAYLIVPLFALSNVGVSIGSGFTTAVSGSLGLGIIFGLLIGKQVGIIASTWMIVRLGVTRLPPYIKFRHIYGVSWLAGIGFTMSLFITELAFATPEQLETAKMGVLVASLIAGVGGWLLLNRTIEWDDDEPDPTIEQPAESSEAREMVRSAD